MLCGIVDSLNDLLSIVLLIESTNGTSNDTLTAVYAGCLCEVALKCATDNCVIATVLCADSTDALELVTCCGATTAKDTLIGIADDGYAGVIDGKLLIVGIEIVFL